MATKPAPTLDYLREEARRRLPSLDGKLTVKGLDGPVRVVWDRHGVPHARVSSTHDMWFAQGFIHAQDRLWGMERTRRFFHGTLSEVVGEGGLGPDRLYRRVGLMRAARREWPHLEEEGRLVVEAYTAGVNAYLDLGYPLPIEFEILDYSPARWEPTDVTGRWKLIVYSQSMNGQVKLSRLQLLRALGPELFAKLFPYFPADAPTIVPSAQPAGERPMAELMRLFEEAHAQAGLYESNGSNNWAVDGTLTASGAPLLAGDPHLAITVPSFWHVQHIEGPDFGFVGASMPGVPGVTYYGHNGHTAWSVTTAGADAQDLFLEQIQEGSPWLKPEYIDFLRRFHVWDYSPQNIAALEKYDVRDVRLCRVGYVPQLDYISDLPECEEDIDVLFYGTLNERRSAVIKQLEEEGLRVESSFGVYGLRRDRLILRSKIVINIHYYESKVMEIVRLSFLMANKRFIVSENGNDKSMERSFEGGIVFVDYDSMVETCCRYVNNVTERKEIAVRGHEIFIAHNQEAFLKKALQ
ncbi:MAG: penicillin acylase family protein [Chloroflexi bacterium]|nr:penicillin acylase family protein [Chloroflexota bacterium]